MNRKETKEEIFSSFTKAVLLRYLSQRVFLSHNELGMLRPALMFLEWEIESERARKLMDEAIAGSKTCSGVIYRDPERELARRTIWMGWQRKFDEAQRVYDHANAIYERAEKMRAAFDKGEGHK